MPTPTPSPAPTPAPGPAPMTAQDWIDRLGLLPLEFEGGWFREVFRAVEEVPAAALPARYDTPRALYTTIHYLLAPDTFSALHRLRSDEVYTFVAGDPVTMLQLHPDGTGREVRLANDGTPGAEPVVCVPHGVWQGSRLSRDSGSDPDPAPGPQRSPDASGRHGYALLTATMAPGWSPADFELGERAALAAGWPAFAGPIGELTRA